MSIKLKQLRRSAAIMFLALLGGACGMNLRPQPLGVEARIAGQWQLQSPQREAVAGMLRTVMEQAHAKQEKRDRNRYSSGPEDVFPGTTATPPSEADAPPAGPPGNRRDNNWEAREQREQREALINALLPSNKLQITQAAMRIEFQPDAGARRRFDVGVSSTLVSNYAALRIESGWQGDVFVVHSRDAQQNINIVERYWRVGETLQMQVQLSLPDAKDQLFVAIYELSK